MPTGNSNSDNNETQSIMPERRVAWLTPQFGFQLLTWSATTLILLGGFAWSIKGDVRSISEEQVRQGSAIQEIRQQLPNKEASDLRIKQIEDRLEVIDRYIDKTEARWDNVNTRLSRKGL